jgi:hypothetical protein
MSAKLAFRLAAVAMMAMLAIAAFMGVSAPPCHELPMSTLTAFELARTSDDLFRIFGMASDACRAPITAQLDHANLLDAGLYVPAYAAFYALALFGLGRGDKVIGWAGVAIVLGCAVADWIENAAMFKISAAPDAPGGWLTVLMIATNIKWLGLALATTLSGVMLWRRGGLGWVGFLLCAVPLAPALWALVAPDAAGKYLIPGMTAASVMLLAVAAWGSFARQAPVAGHEAKS